MCSKSGGGQVEPAGTGFVKSAGEIDRRRRCSVEREQELLSARMMSAHILEKATSSNVDINVWTTSRSNEKGNYQSTGLQRSDNQTQKRNSCCTKCCDKEKTTAERTAVEQFVGEYSAIQRNQRSRWKNQWLRLSRANCLELREQDLYYSGKYEADRMIGVENDPDEERRTDDESMTLEEILSTIPAGSSLPSTTGEVTKIQLGKSIQFRDVNEEDWYKASVPKICTAEKGKAPLHEKDPIKGNLKKEIFALICADIDLLVQLREQLREQVIDEVDRVFNSFSFKKLAALKLEEIYAKEELVLTWAETDSTKVALQRRMFILTKYRELLLRKFLETRQSNFVSGTHYSAIDLQVLDKLSDLHLFVLEELKAHTQAHGLRWEKTCCSKIFEGKSRDRGAVMARSNTNTKSSFWIRTMVCVNESWVIEPCADYWKPLPRQVVCNEDLPQVSYVDTLPTVSEFFKLLRKRWADEVKAHKAELFKDIDDRLATIRSEQLDFRAQAQENYNNLSTQLGFLVEYIDRGGDAKKGKGGSSRPQPPPDDQNRPSGGSASRGSGSGGSSRRDDRRDSSKKRRSSSGGGSHSTGGGPYGPYKKDAEY
ncbi:hypothetical protein F511_36762 [Dorcoceras hygrometricum]|uniref:Uncharacterized protein n=1 Tax=Dorcoceras hygrometricum TaxID=472368 RepID=A0A2Z7AUL6_9LAMI|nr:hypothetical protein F511_36762 [Dorcoceras hygrometricum]